MFILYPDKAASKKRNQTYTSRAGQVKRPNHDKVKKEILTNG